MGNYLVFIHTDISQGIKVWKKEATKKAAAAKAANKLLPKKKILSYNGEATAGTGIAKGAVSANKQGAKISAKGKKLAGGGTISITANGLVKGGKAGSRVRVKVVSKADTAKAKSVAKKVKAKAAAAKATAAKKEKAAAAATA